MGKFKLICQTKMRSCVRIMKSSQKKDQKKKMMKKTMKMDCVPEK